MQNNVTMSAQIQQKSKKLFFFFFPDNLISHFKIVWYKQNIQLISADTVLLFLTGFGCFQGQKCILMNTEWNNNIVLKL